MAVRRNALGRGLDALIPPARSSAPKPAASTPASAETPASAPLGTHPAGRSELPVAEITANPDQPRRVFDEAELARLADSIKRHGVLQPVVVRLAKGNAERPYELVVGERRWRASQLAGRETIPATILDVAPRDLLELALIENVQRQDLNPIELALAFRELLDEGTTQEEVGRRVGLDRSSISNHLRLLELPRELQGDVESGDLSMGHAKALLSISNPERRRHLRDRIVSDQISVRAAEQIARESSQVTRPPKHPKARTSAASRSVGADPNLQSLIDALREHLQSQVRIHASAEGGRIEIDFYSPEDLHRLSQTILAGERA